jgi:hypothetical protein
LGEDESINYRLCSGKCNFKFTIRKEQNAARCWNYQLAKTVNHAINLVPEVVLTLGLLNFKPQRKQVA